MVEETSQQLAHVAVGTGAALVPRPVAALQIEGVVCGQFTEPASAEHVVVGSSAKGSPVPRCVLEELVELVGAVWCCG